MSKHLLITLCCILYFTQLRGQSYTTTGGAIPDDGSQVAFPITVLNLPQPTINSAFGLSTVCINITHPWVGDLAIKLKAPDGMIVNLSLNEGNGGDNYTNTCFHTSSPNILYLASAPFTGTYKPQGALGNVNNGQNGNGVWELLIEDIGVGDVGTLDNFSLTFDNTPSQPSNFTSSNLPIVVINTNGVTIRKEPKKMVKMGIIDNGVGMVNHLSDPYNNYNGWAGMEYRGATSGEAPQKSYNIELRDALEYDISAPLLSMPWESDWALVAAYGDESLMRNAMTYELCNQMNYYAPRTRFCEVVLDGEYMGVYSLTEKIKRDPNRVDIAKLQPEDTTGDELTGGYIVKIDKPFGNSDGSWISPYPPMHATGSQYITFRHEYPKRDDRQLQQKEYIRKYIDSFEKALASPDFADTNVGYRHFADMNSFIDYFIINEASRNIDAYANSYFFYKDKNSNGGKLKSGPVWDFNIAWLFAWWCNANSDTGWAYNVGLECPNAISLVPFWWGRMLEDTNFTNTLKCRWLEVRATTLSDANIFTVIDNNAFYLADAQQRHAEKWQTPGGYLDALDILKDAITSRMAWLDANMPGYCRAATIQEYPRLLNNISIYPNPFFENIKLDFNAQSHGDLTIEVYSAVGQRVYAKTCSYTAGRNHFELDIPDQLPPGLYLLKAGISGYSYSQNVIKQAK
jgi:subtilisin-like proprotein convertase family protein